MAPAGRSPVGQIDGRFALAVVDFFSGAGAEAAAVLNRLAAAGSFPPGPGPITRVGFDGTSWATLRDLLGTAGVVNRDGRIDPAAAATAALLVDAVADAMSVVAARTPEPPSRLVVTATASEDVAGLRDRLGVPSLYGLIERTVRSARARVTLGAPFWNEAALDLLGPAVEGALSRGCTLDLVAQGGGRRPTGALHQIVAWTEGLRRAGPVTLWLFDADALSDRHIVLHAKFALADDTAGYLGSANLTDQGFAVNFEIGVAVGGPEARQLLAVLDGLRSAAVLTAHPIL